LDARHVLGDGGFPKNLEPLEDALVGEVEMAVAVSAVFFDGLLEGTLLCDVPLFVAVIAEAVATSASKKGMLDWTSMTWSQGHPVLGCHAYWGVGDMRVSNLL